jgi:hypothetical protein
MKPIIKTTNNKQAIITKAYHAKKAYYYVMSLKYVPLFGGFWAITEYCQKEDITSLKQAVDYAKSVVKHKLELP